MLAVRLFKLMVVSSMSCVAFAKTDSSWKTYKTHNQGATLNIPSCFGEVAHGYVRFLSPTLKCPKEFSEGFVMRDDVYEYYVSKEDSFDMEIGTKGDPACAKRAKELQKQNVALDCGVSRSGTRYTFEKSCGDHRISFSFQDDNKYTGLKPLSSIRPKYLIKIIESIKCIEKPKKKAGG